MSLAKLERRPHLLSLSAVFILCGCHAGAPPGVPGSPAPACEAVAAPSPAAQETGSAPELRRVTYQSAATHGPRDYFLYLPRSHASEAGKLWPVLMVLHGNGERGDGKGELDYLLKNGPLYEAWIQKRELPFIIAAPQLPMYGQDAQADYLKNRTRAEIPQRLDRGVPPRPAAFATPPAMTGAIAEALPSDATPYGPPEGWPELELDVLGIIDSLVRDQRGDPARLYLTGISYGGFGTWFLASKHPERFAAIAPVVGYGHPDLMDPIARARIPTWCFAGGLDSTVPVKYFFPGLNRLRALGHTARFTVEADMGHDVWGRVYAGDDLYGWLLAQRRERPRP